MEINEHIFRKDIQKWMKTYAEAYCKQASKEITIMASEAIQKFYDDYTPKYYNRTNDLLKNSYSPYYHNNGKNVYGGVKISSTDMQPYNKAGITKFEIASSAWKKGLHGFENMHAPEPIFTFPPIVTIEMRMKEKKFLDKLNNVGDMAARKQTYSYFKL